LPDAPPSLPDAPPSLPDAPPSLPDAPPSVPDAPPSLPDAPPSLPDVFAFDTPVLDRPVATDRTAPADACALPRVACGAACVDLTSDVANCGACANACAAGAPCVASVCGVARPLEVVMVSEGLSTTPNGPMRSSPLTSLRITFSLPVSGVTYPALRLYYQGRSISLRTMTVAGSGTVRTLTLPTNLTSLRGLYRFDIGGPMTTIRSGTLAMTMIHSVYWQRI
jgi:hypothetical protein